MEIKELYFYDQRFQISHFSRILARFICYSFYIISTTGAIIFLLSDVEKLFWLGILILFFIGDRLIHFGQAERSIIGLIRYLPRPERRKEKKSFIPGSVNVSHYLTPVGFGVLERAYDKTLLINGNFYLYVLKFLFQLPDIKESILRMDVDVNEMAKKIDDIIDAEIKNADKSGKNIKNKENLSGKIESFAKLAFIDAINNKNKFIESADLFSALGKINDQDINRILNLFNINPNELEYAMIFSRFNRGFWKSLPKSLGGFVKRQKRLRHRVMNRAWTAKPTPILDSYSIDFTDLAAAGESGFLIGHKNEYDRLINILSRPIKPNALLIGEPGSGKETIISALAYGIIKDEVPDIIFDKRLVGIQISSLISGSSSAEISGKLNKIVNEIISAGNIILYIPDIHNLIKPFGEGAMSAADILMPIVNGDDFPIIGATYAKEFKQHIELLSDFTNAFEVIRVEEVSENEAIQILVYDSLILEKQYNIKISFGAIKNAIVLSHKYLKQKLLPASAQDLLREALSSASQRKNKFLQAGDIIDIVERKINIPIHLAGKEEAEQLLNLENIIHQFLVDQEPAVSAVSRALREYRSGLGRKGGPIANFLFIGPTGVGKTELSKILAKVQFGSENAMIRFDMSEYQNKESIARFIGSPDGKISGSLTESIIQKPHSLILLDEFEKAHSDILNIFLQVFDDARLTDNLGRTVDFTNTIIIATSNANSNFIKERIEAGDKIEKISEELKKKLTEYFRPELLNRFSEIVVFKNLSQSDIEKIAKFQFISLAKTLEETQGIILSYSDDVVKKIAELGYDPVFGARPLRGVLSNKIKSVLAEKILRGDIIKGSTVEINIKDGEIIIA